MSLFHEHIKQILAEVEKFLADTLKKETAKLSKKTLEHKQQILDKLLKFYEDNPSMKVTADGSSTGKEEQNDSISTSGSNKSDDSQDPVYNEAGISIVGAADLENPVVCGFLEKKQKKGSGLFGGSKFQQRWCVLHGGIFYYFTKQDDKKQAGSFRLEGYKFRAAPDLAPKKTQKDLCFELYQDDDKRVYQFMAKSKEDFEKWHNFIDGGGNALIEDEIYEVCGEDPLPAPSTPKKAHPVPPLAVPTLPAHPVTSPPIEEDIYEETEGGDGLPPPAPPARPLPSSVHLLPPPPPPIETSPAAKRKVSIPEPIQDDIYDDGFSAPVAPEAPVPPIPPTVRKQLATRNLPELPPLPKAPEPEPVIPPKKRIKITLTCKPEEDFENKYYGLWDCEGDNSTELSFKKGEIIHILSKEFDEKSWWIGELNGKFGLVPKDYMTPAFVALA